jgi:hypothetical protein
MLSYYEIYEDFWVDSPNKPIHKALETNVSKRRLDGCSNNVVYVFSWSHVHLFSPQLLLPLGFNKLANYKNGKAIEINLDSNIIAIE